MVGLFSAFLCGCGEIYCIPCMAGASTLRSISTGMLLGLVQYVIGQKHLKHVGNFIGASENEEEKAALKKPLTKIEKDRVTVLLLSFVTS